ncbi:MAG: YggT family protein [Burkholderiaceae bacterium]
MLLVDIARLLIETVAALLGVTLLLRAYMNWIGMPARNPLAQFVFALTDWLVRPLRRVIPAAGRVDTASLVAAYLIAVLLLVLTFLLIGAGSGVWPWGTVFVAAFVHLARWVLYLVMWLTIIHVVLSWVNPYAPVAPAMAMLVRPFLAPFQRLVPLVGGIDLSPVVLIVVVNILLLVVNRSGF